MNRVWLVRIMEMAVITVALAAVCQELEKPQEERTWCGKVGFIPYDFRFPTIERIREGYWNEDSPNVFSTEVIGLGWAINFHAILEKMRLVGESYYTEDDFLMPTPTMRKILENRPAIA
jgi:hypothetical protein